MKKLILAAAFSAVAFTAQATCVWFGGKRYCPPEDGSQFVLPCTSTSCLSERPIPELPPAPVAPAPRIAAVIAPTDANGQPAKFVNLCTQNGCSVTQAPVVVVETPPPQPDTVWWYQPPAVAIPIAVGWGPMLGTGPYNLPSGPPLHSGKHR